MTFPLSPRCILVASGLLLGVLLGASPAATQGGGATSEVYGMRALQDHQGRDTSLRRVAAGQPLVVVVMKSVECLVCRGQLQRLGKRIHRLTRLEARVVGLAHDGAGAADGVPTGSFGGFAVLSDRQHGVLRALRLWRPTWGHPLPSLLVFDRCGVERARLEGRGPGLRPERAIFRVLEQLAKEPCARQFVDAR